MTKRELYAVYERLLAERGMRRIDGITINSNKQELQGAIKCLSCDNATLDVYMDVVKKTHPNIARAVLNNGDWHTHYFNRYMIYGLAVMAINNNAA